MNMLRHFALLIVTACPATAFSQATTSPAPGSTVISGSEAADFFNNLSKAGAKATTVGQTTSIVLDALQCQASGDGFYCWLTLADVQENAGQIIDQGIYHALYQELANHGAERSAGRALETNANGVSCQQVTATHATACQYTVQ